MDLGKRDPLNSLASAEKKIAMCPQGEGGFGNNCSSNCRTTKRCGIGRCGPSFSTTNRCSSNCSTTKRCGISRCGSSCGGTKLGPSYCKKRQTGAQCLKEGPVLGPISRGWFWSLWPYFGAPVMPFANQTRTVIHLCLFSCSHQFPGNYKCSEAIKQ